MKPINRGIGLTESERYLAKLADKTFLNLWSYPNTFKDKQSKNGGDGKEICDLLVVCGNDVIVFSDKMISWPQHEDINTSWSRWYKRAVAHSVGQIRGAQRWLRNSLRAFSLTLSAHSLCRSRCRLWRKRVSTESQSLWARKPLAASFATTMMDRSWLRAR